MCGRFVVAGAADDLVALFDIDLVGEDLPEDSWNVAPTDRVPVVIDARDRNDPDGPPVRRLEPARWGLVPAWAKDMTAGARAINARIETAAEKPAFAKAVAGRRAMVPANGYYEWQTVDGIKRPRFIHLPEGEWTLFAGLYEWWRDDTVDKTSPEHWVLSTSILTRASSGPLQPIHDRMPVFLTPDLVDVWLDPETVGDESLLEAVAAGSAETAERMTSHEVDRAVGSVRVNGPQLIEPLAG